jgi:voltage-gated potassium channel Kch
VIFAFVITALATPLLYGRAYELHGWIRPLLEKLGFKAPPERRAEGGEQYKLALLGFYREASSLLYNLQQANPELVRETLVVDFNVALHQHIQRTGAHVHYGDLSNTETLHHVGLERARVIVCTIPDDLLRGITNRSLVRVVRNMCPNAIIIANAVSLSRVQPIYEAGADWVYQSRLEAARALGEAIDAALNDRIAAFRETRMQINRYSQDRREVLD